ncbi:truA1 [Scenedesmus sp. PABB004]|nr:truA1 [Scenedesmus sp. PABB004]
MLGANACMTALFVGALVRLPSLQATVLANAANMLVTGLLGRWLFGEAITMRWAAGIALVIAGLLLISRAAAPQGGRASNPAPPPDPQRRRREQPPRGAAAKADGDDAGGDAGCEWVPPDPELGRVSYRLLVAYDGTAYSGWQLQPGRARTIQGEFERVLGTALQEGRRTLCVCAAGRTDAGVHARGQVVQFYSNAASLDPAWLPGKLNSMLPHDVRVLWAARTAPDFSVTVSALRKTYHYAVDVGAAHDPLRHRFATHARRALDVPAMRAGAALLVGTHDFTQFSNAAPERLRRNPVKRLEALDVVDDGPAGLRLEARAVRRGAARGAVRAGPRAPAPRGARPPSDPALTRPPPQVTGSGFLYKQVRHMAGALLALGEGRLGLDAIAARLALGAASPPGAGGVWRGYNVAPAKGLCLVRVEYPPAVDDPGALLYPERPHDAHGRLLHRARAGAGGSAGGSTDADDED